MKYELRVLSHLVIRQIAMISTGMAMEDTQWQTTYSEVQQMVGLSGFFNVGELAGNSF